MSPSPPPSWVESLRTTQEEVHKILVFIEGDGTESNPGWKIRLDRLEQAAKTRSTILTIIVVPLFFLMIDRVVHYLA